MDNIRYHLVRPSNSKDVYNEFDTVSWELVSDGRALVKNSITVEAEVEIFSTGTTRKTQANNIKLSNIVGAHAFFESWSCESLNAGQLETLQQYPRYVNMVGSASLDSEDLLNGKFLCEMRNPVEEGTGAMIEEQVSYNDNPTHVAQKTNASFSIKPMLCFNRMSGNYSFSAKGAIRIQCNLSRAIHALFGRSLANDGSYNLRNLVLRYTSVPDENPNERLFMESYVGIKSSINSTDATISSRVPSKAVNAVSVSMLESNHESNDRTKDTFRCEVMKQIDEVNYLFNNSQQKFITYSLTDRADMIAKGLESLQNSGHHQASGNKLAGNKAFIIGTDFGEYVDLSNQKFTFNIKSSDASIATNPRLVFLYFHQLLSM